jgi:hypothetical protein
MYWSNSARVSWYSARNFASSRRRDQSVAPLITGIGLRYRVQAVRSMRLNRPRVRGCQVQ